MNTYKKILAFILVTISLSFHSFSESKEINIQIKTVNYADGLQADLFKISSKKLAPAVILIHGGYWCGGTRKDLSDFATKLAKNGYVAMNVDYHILPQYNQKFQTTDITDAIWWLRGNSKKLGINPSKIAVVGISSGAYLAAWAATHDKINSKKIHSRPNAVVSLYGPWNLTDEAEKGICQESVKLVKQFCAGEDRKTASPLYSISPATPPVLLVHGSADTIVPASQSIEAYEKLKSQHCKCKLVIEPDVGHCCPNTESYFNAIKISINFLNNNLK